jgi:hypothetical protein
MFGCDHRRPLHHRCRIGGDPRYPGRERGGRSPAQVLCGVDDYLECMHAKSLRCGHLPATEKAAALRKIYGVPRPDVDTVSGSPRRGRRSSVSNRS